jgi:hypothetical protein
MCGLWADRVMALPFLTLLAPPDNSAAHPMLLVASYQKSGPGTARARTADSLRWPTSALGHYFPTNVVKM